MLAAGSRDLPERQQTLRGAIAWSYDLLSEGERRLLWRLAAFSGGFDVESAEAVCGPADEIGRDVLDGIMSLTDQSLVKAEEIEGVSRFRQLDTIHEFAAEHLAESGEEAEIERRHEAFFLALVERAAPQLSGADQRRWLGVIERDHDNIRAAMDRAVAAADADAAIRFGFSMWRYWQKRGHLAEARRRLAAIADQPWSRDDPVLRARLMEALGGVGWWMGDSGAAGAELRRGAPDLAGDRGQEGDRQRPLQPFVHLRGQPRRGERGPRRRRARRTGRGTRDLPRDRRCTGRGERPLGPRQLRLLPARRQLTGSPGSARR